MGNNFLFLLLQQKSLMQNNKIIRKEVLISLTRQVESHQPPKSCSLILRVCVKLCFCGTLQANSRGIWFIPVKDQWECWGVFLFFPVLIWVHWILNIAFKGNRSWNKYSYNVSSSADGMMVINQETLLHTAI